MDEVKPKKPRKPIRATFIGGPLHRQVIEMYWIPEVNIFTSERDRIIYAYVREETEYYYDKDMSACLTAMYDRVKNRFKINRIVPLGEKNGPEGLTPGDRL